jgi:hypothetical protein
VKMILEKAGRTYVFEKATVQQVFVTCKDCCYRKECNDRNLMEVDVWLYCIGLMPTIYICTEVINGNY